MVDEPGTIDESTGDYNQFGPLPRRRRVRLDIGALTHPGLARENNEDQFLAARLGRTLTVESSSLARPEGGVYEESGHLLVVADGMGGVAGGERASTLAVESVRDFILRGFRSFLHAERSDEGAILRELKSGIERADRAILVDAATDPSLDGMGTTLTIAYFVAGMAYILHAGDSRAYLLRGGELRRVTTDHTLVQMMVAGGQITAEDARTHQSRNVVTNVLGGPNEGVHLDVHRLDLEDLDLLLLCSDGLTEPIDDPTIAAVLLREPDPESAASALVDEALRRGGPDNVTVVIARVHLEG